MRRNCWKPLLGTLCATALSLVLYPYLTAPPANSSQLASVAETPGSDSPSSIQPVPTAASIETEAAPAQPIAPVEPAVLQGVDISRSARLPEPASWQVLKASGCDFVIVGAWGGRRQNQYAQAQLQMAFQAGMKVAAYCFLNFDNDAHLPGAPASQTGGWQVQQALEAIGPMRDALAFLAVDVEPRYKGRMSPQARVQRIREAVTAIKRAGLPPVIYAKDRDWNRLTGNSDAFKHIPLWDTRWNGDTSLEMELGEAWQSYGGWEKRAGKQYLGDMLYPIGMGLPVDWDMMDAALFRERNAGKLAALKRRLDSGAIPEAAVASANTDAPASTDGETASLSSNQAPAPAPHPDRSIYRPTVAVGAATYPY